MKYDTDRFAGAISEEELAAFGFDEDFCEQVDGWGHDENGLDYMADPTNNHALAKAAAQRVEEGADVPRSIHE